MDLIDQIVYTAKRHPVLATTIAILLIFYALNQIVEFLKLVGILK